MSNPEIRFLLRPRMTLRCGRAFLVALLLAALAQRGLLGADLETGFGSPPAAAKPWVWWFWIDGNVSREGITLDLEAMQRVGIGGAILFDVTQDVPAGPVAFASPEWHALFKHAVNEAGRLGLQLTIHNAAGWSSSGGPWIPPELGMQQVCYGVTNLSGPSRFSGPLPRLPDESSFCHDIAILAFPSVAGEGGPLPGWPPQVTTSASNTIEGARLVDNNPATFITLPAPTARCPEYVQLKFAEPFPASRLKLVGTGHPQKFKGRIEISDDGKIFTALREFESANSGISLPFDQVSSRYFRLLFIEANSATKRLEFSKLVLTPNYRVELFQAKSGAGQSTPVVTTQEHLPIVPAEGLIVPGSVIELTLGPTGTLTWQVPPGHWTVLRLAYAPNGTENHPARAGGLGLECDKLNREGIRKHFDAFLGPLIAEQGQPAGRALVGTMIDSWEVGFQNWTPRFLEEFRRRRGYDPLCYLPALSGRYVGSSEQTARFFWDMRRTVADLFADNYAGQFANLAHQHGLQAYIEPYASYGKGPFDDLQYAARADVPMIEFWAGPRDFSVREDQPVVSAAHTWGKAIVASESFSSNPDYARWQEHPFTLKPVVDAMFCEGINRLVFHCFPHQPWPDRRPGLTLSVAGSHYQRTQTWWEQATLWHQYLAKSQFLLQQGLYAADVCYLAPEGAYTEAPALNKLDSPVPAGCRHDVATSEVVLTLMSVKSNRVVLPDGATYSVLVLPSGKLMTPKLLRKINDLVEAGATVIGAPPARSPSLEDYPRCDSEVRQLAAALWGACDGRNLTERRVGKGKIVWGKPLAQVLAEMAVPPDLETPQPAEGWPLHWIHKRLDATDIYFLAQANPHPMRCECRFRVAGKRPELWHPESGTIERVAAWHEQDGKTVVPITIDREGSVFVVFREDAQGADPVVKFTRDGQEDTEAHLSYDAAGRLHVLARRPGTYQAETRAGKKSTGQINSLGEPCPIEGKWELRFPPGWGAPPVVVLDHLTSWSNRPEPGIRYFSGTATYIRTFRVDQAMLAAGRKSYLDLGKVQVIAEVKVNGTDLGILWRPPFEVDITGVARAGDNMLQVKVTNLWPNRLIGDEQLPDDCRWLPSSTPGSTGPLAEWPEWLLQGRPSPTGRLTFTTWKHWTKNSPLIESGLLGPVTLRATGEVTLK